MRISKFIISATVALSAFAGIGAASAADLAPRPYTKVPVIVDPGYNWTGFYVGANLGWSFGRSSTDYTIAGLPFGSTSQRMESSVACKPATTGRTAVGCSDWRPISKRRLRRAVLA